jgi:3-oxoacyl-[acyl-carrier protein] reductase
MTTGTDVIGINLKGSFLCAQATARQMVAHGHSGAIVNRSSNAVGGTRRDVHYNASKSGIVSMALELATDNIRVNAVAPGPTDTAQPRYGHSDEEVRAMGRALPLGRLV